MSSSTTAEATDGIISNSTTQMENKEKCHKTEQGSDLIYQVPQHTMDIFVRNSCALSQSFQVKASLLWLNYGAIFY